MDEPSVEEIRACENDLGLQSAAATSGEEGVGVLEITVAFGDATGDLTLGEGRAVECGDDSDHVLFDLRHFCESDFK